MNGEEKLICIFPSLSGRKLTVEEIDLEIAVRNALKQSNIRTLARLLQLSHSELLGLFPNRELRSYEDVIHCLVRLSEETEQTGVADPEFTSAKDIADTLGCSKVRPKKFNIFQVAGIWKSEEIHTSVIAELLNPGSAFHDKGAVFLDRFLRIIGEKLPPEELENASVETEVPTEEGRRIDMVIATDHFYLPFEVKIWSGDQDAQLWDYYIFAKKEAGKRGQKKPKVFYLTPTGHEPDVRSRKELSDDQICRLSFKGHILHWLKACMKEPDLPSDVLEIMKQLHDNIAGSPTRPAQPGFSRWQGDDVLSTVYQKLTEQYDLLWTECTADYMTFTLNKKRFGTVFLEFALRIKKEGRNHARLFLICGLTREDEKPDYAGVGDYIAENAETFNELLTTTFKNGGKTLELKSSSVKSVWDRLPEKDCYKNLDAEQCCHEIEKIFKELLFEPGTAPNGN